MQIMSYLASFYQDSSKPSETKTQRKNNKKALLFSVLDELAKDQVTDTNTSITQLTIGAAFFACRLCELLNTQKSQDKNRNPLNSCASETSAFSKMDVSCPRKLTTWNQQIMWLLHSKCRRTFRNMTLSFMVRQTTVFCAPYFNGHVLCPESEHIQVHHWILQCAHSGKTAVWNTSPPKTSFNT